MAYKTYKDLKKRLKRYEYQLQIANQEFEKWLPGAKERYKRYRGTLRPTQVSPDGHAISTPIGTATIDALFASLTAVEVDISVTAVGKGTRDEAYLAQSALRQEWRTSRVQRKCEPALKDALITDIGWVKVLYEYEEHDEVRPRPQELVDAEIETEYQTANVLGAELPDPDEVAANVEVAEEVTIVDSDRIIVDYVPFENLRWDPFAKRIEDIRWFIQVTKMTREEIENTEAWVEYMKLHKTYSKLDDLKPDSVLANEVKSLVPMGQDLSSEDEFFTVCETWDLDTATFCIHVKGADFLLFESHNPYSIFPDKIDRSPFVPFILREDPENVRGISDMRLMFTALEELDLYRSNLATYTDRYVPKTLIKNGALTEAGKLAVKSREYGAIVEMEAGYEPSTDSRDLSPPSLPAEIFNMPERLENEIREATGVSELMRGMFPEGTRRSARETQEVVAGSAGRQAEKRNRTAEAYRGIAKRMLRLMQMFYDNERIARVVDEYGEIEWYWTSDDIVLDAELEIFLTPKEEKTMQQRKEDVLGLFNLLGPLPIVDQAALVRYGLEEMGVPRTLIAEIVKTPEAVQVEQQAANQQAAEEAAIAEGAPPNPTNVPGPFAGADLAAAANPGEIPPGVAAGAAGAAPGSEDVIASLLQQ